MARFTVWVDGDSCPVAVRNVILRASLRRSVPTVFVSDRDLPVAESESCRLVVVERGADAADDYIARSVASADLVVTRDVVLTDRVVNAGATVIDDRGREYTSANTAERRSIHEFMSTLRNAGVYQKETRRPGTGSAKGFADAFDRFVTRALAED